MAAKRRIFSIAHSYVVGMNRRLAHEIARAGGDRWEVIALAPEYFQGGRDLRPVTFAREADEPCEVRAISTRFTRSPHLFWYGSKLRELLRSARPGDLVHQWEEPYVLAGAQVAWHTPADVPLVFWTAQNLSKTYPPPFAQFERYCLKRCAAWMACGHEVLKALSSRSGYTAKPHHVMPLGVDAQLFCPDANVRRATRRELGFDDDGGPPVVGFIGRFTEEKGVGFLTAVLDAMPTPWRAVFVGAGPMEARLRAWADRHSPRVRVRTDVAHADVPRFLNAIDVLCAPSQTTPSWREQFGRMIVEAFASGVPVIGSDSGEIPHVIGDAGIICPERDETAWRDSIATLLESPSRRAELAQRGLARVNEHYAWPVIGRRHVEFFDQVAGTWRGAR